MNKICQPCGKANRHTVIIVSVNSMKTINIADTIKQQIHKKLLISCTKDNKTINFMKAGDIPNIIKQ